MRRRQTLVHGARAARTTPPPSARPPLFPSVADGGRSGTLQGHPIYHFAAARPEHFGLYIPASGALPTSALAGRYEYFLFQYLKVAPPLPALPLTCTRAASAPARHAQSSNCPQRYSAPPLTVLVVGAAPRIR
eukprot:SAG11_NODE_15802_length_566_cov_0.473233_1_plen_132_part_10